MSIQSADSFKCGTISSDSFTRNVNQVTSSSSSRFHFSNKYFKLDAKNWQFLCSVRRWASHHAVSLRGQQTGKVLNLSIFSSFYFRLEEAPHVGHDVFVRFDPSTPFQSAKIPSRSIFRLKYFELIRSIHFHLTRLFRFFGENISRVPVTYCSSLSLTTGIFGGWSIPVRKSLTGRSGSVPHISPSSPTGGTYCCYTFKSLPCPLLKG